MIKLLKNFKKLELKTLERAVAKVRQEFSDLGILTTKIDDININMLMGFYGAIHAIVKDRIFSPIVMGYYNGDINIPEYCYRPDSISNVLRHEYGHAFAEQHPAPFKSRSFISAFGGKYTSGVKTEMQSPDRCITNYAATDIAEDFAETFMFYIKYKGKLPKKYSKNEFIQRKWEATDNAIGILKGYI